MAVLSKLKAKWKAEAARKAAGTANGKIRADRQFHGSPEDADREAVEALLAKEDTKQAAREPRKPGRPRKPHSPQSFQSKLRQKRRHQRATEITDRSAAHEAALAFGRQSLLGFTLYTKRDYGPPVGREADPDPEKRVSWHHRLLADALDRVAAGEIRRLMVFMPPQHGKSELVSRRFPAWLLGRNPNFRLIQASHTYDLACAMNRDVQRIMIDDTYARLFPRSVLGAAPKFSKTAAVEARKTMDFFEIPGFKGSLRSAGVGNSIAGNPADGAIVDDPIGKREDADSAVFRERLWDWYTNDLYTRLAADAWIVITHTRWHRDDLAGRLLRKMADRDGDQWEILSLEAVRGESDGNLYDPRQAGEPLWPAFKSERDLEIIRQQDAKTYAALYQQNPTEATSAEWAMSLQGDWMWANPEKWPEKFDLKVVCVDGSKGRQDKAGDYTAIIFLGVSNGLLWIDAIIERIPLDQIVRKTILFCDKYKPDMVGIEAEQFQELLVHEFRRQCGDDIKTAWPIYMMMSKGANKEFRIRRLDQYITNREIRLRRDSPGCRLLLDQLMDFPTADHDDGPDALEMCVRLPREAMAL